MADTPILNYKGKYDGPEIDKAVELALGLDNPKSCPYYVHVSLSKPDYVLTIGLGDSEGNLFNHTEIDLPLESMVVNATYENGNIILHLQDGTSTEPIPISALITGLVSETRTIAGIDLKDNITPKELRDALDVYTKDSVDQLVSDLEDRINETLDEMKKSLNDLSDLTSEHDTQIKKNISDIAIDKSNIATIDHAVGSPSKNLFNVNGEINSIYNGTIVTDSSSNVVNGNVITLNRSASNQYPSGQFIKNLKDKKIIISFDCINLAEATNGTIRIYRRDVANPIFSEYFGEIKRYTYTVNISYDEILISFGTSGTLKGVQIENVMVRLSDITDDTYESYKPSVNERLTANENDTAINRATLGTQCKNFVIVRPSVSGEYYGTVWTKNADESITINGTATQNNFPIIADFTPTKIGKYILSGCPKGGGNGSYQLYIEELGYDAGIGVTLNVTALKTYRVKIATYNNYTYNSLTFYPMIRPADITDSVYEPYKPSVNERLIELANDIKKIYGLGTPIPTGADLNDPIYLEPGVYVATSNSVAGSLLNSPIKRGFRMEVKTTIYNGLAVRLIYPNANRAEFGTFYMQNITSDGGILIGNWYKFAGAEVLPTTVSE